jgi:Golgi apparatus protein 1
MFPSFSTLFQVTLEDYHFSVKFKEACKDDVARECKGMKKKAEVIGCLSKAIRDDTLLDSKHRISEECRAEIRYQLQQRVKTRFSLPIESLLRWILYFQGSNIRLDPELNEMCANDVSRFCSNVSPGRGQVRAF